MRDATLIVCCVCMQLTSKPNARVPLFDLSGDGPWQHPYEFEIQNLEYQPWMLAQAVEHAFQSLADVPFSFVETAEEFDALLAHLQEPSVREIAIDLEAHNLRSYSGFCCLMQVCRRACVPSWLCVYVRVCVCHAPRRVLWPRHACLDFVPCTQLSTRTADFVIDVLKLRSRMQALNVVFTNPQVVKARSSPVVCAVPATLPPSLTGPACILSRRCRCFTAAPATSCGFSATLGCTW
jgi:exosome complex exonuclease RRP6